MPLPRMLFCVGCGKNLFYEPTKSFFSGIYRYICGEHFIATDYRYSLTGLRTLKPGTLPSVLRQEIYHWRKPTNVFKRHRWQKPKEILEKGVHFILPLTMSTSFWSRKSSPSQQQYATMKA